MRVRGSHPVPPAFPCRSASNAPPLCRPYNPGRPERPPVWAPPRSLAATWGITVVFSSCGYLDVSVPRVRPHFRGYRTSLCGGLPHSEIRGSMAICASPRLIAACHVLLRRQEPGHPLCALCNLLDFYSLFLFARTALSRRDLRFLRIAFLLPACQRTFSGGACPLPCVEDNGFEPMTPCVQSRCSSQLSQSPADVVPGGLEPPTPTLSV